MFQDVLLWIITVSSWCNYMVMALLNVEEIPRLPSSLSVKLIKGEKSIKIALSDVHVRSACCYVIL